MASFPSPPAPSIGPSAAAKQPAEVICPALQIDDRPGNNPSDPIAPPTLIVLGSIRERSGGGEKSATEIVVGEVLYGSTASATVPLELPWWLPDDQKRIFVLTPSPYQNAYLLKYSAAPEEAAAQRALAKARLDYNVLSAQSIFVGREIKADGYLRTVKVKRSISGTPLAPGQEVIIESGGFITVSGQEVQPRAEELIYFIRSETPGSKVSGLPDPLRKNSVYQVATTLRSDQQKQVETILSNRSEYPVRSSQPGKQVREILYQGTLAGAIDLMGSGNEAAVNLAARMLYQNRTQALAPVSQAISRDLFRKNSAEPAAYRRLQNLIRLLAAMEKDRSLPVTSRLLDSMLRKISSGTAPQPEAPSPNPYRSPRYPLEEENRSDVNHALAWLAMGFSPGEMPEALAEQLLKLKMEKKDLWLPEIQLALDAGQVEDQIDLKKALARAAGSSSLQIAAPAPPTVRAVCFSHDGTRLGSEKGIYDIRDWSRVLAIDHPGTVAALFFSPDDRYLYLLGGGSAACNFRIDSRSGEKIAILPEQKEGVTFATISKDGRLLLSSSYYEGSARLYQLPEMTLRKEHKFRRGCSKTTLSPDGRYWVLQTDARELTVKDLSNGEQIKIPFEESLGRSSLLFSADGKFFWVSEASSFGSKTSTFLVAEHFTRLPSVRSDPKKGGLLACSPDAKKVLIQIPYVGLAIGDPESKAAPRPFLAEDSSQRREQEQAFSPDGKLLAVATGGGPVRLYDTESLSSRLPRSGHGGRVARLLFSEDGKSLVSISQDNSVCRWDSRTGDQIFRFSVPWDLKIISARNDGRYLATCNAITHNNTVTNYSPQPAQAAVIDTATGQIICRPDLSLGRFNTRIHWIDGQLALSASDTKLEVFNYLTGEKIKTLPTNNNHILNGLGSVPENSRRIFTLGSDSWDSTKIEWIDFYSGAVSTFAGKKLDVFCREYGVVPGKEWFYLADPGVYIYNQQTFQPVSAAALKGADLFATVFSRDGGKYAAVTSKRIFIDDNLNQHDPKVESMVRVHDSLSGKTLWAQAAPQRWIREMAFSPAGDRLALLTHEGGIHVWNLTLP